MKFLPSIRKSTESTENLQSDELTLADLEADISSNIPTLQQILDRKSLPPVCLYNLYIVMRDRLRNEEILDFYLDLKHHEVLWRKYIRSLCKAGILDETDVKDGVSSMPLATKVQTFEKTITTHATSSPESNEAAERITHRYIVQSAHKELVELPMKLRAEIVDDIQEHGRYDPLIFSNAKAWAFNAMQHFSYSKFIDIKSTGNLTQWHQILRLCFGLSVLFVAFAVELTMLFLGWQVWGSRTWVSGIRDALIVG
ncbi:hypothetical protein BGW37DRAFT_454976 [Umbelopsis sp. PMI_123]|nr:hypothetical protein BGW37DRAFT_454976 [Umbelopsis sp. PMI_123]